MHPFDRERAGKVAKATFVSKEFAEDFRGRNRELACRGHSPVKKPAAFTPYFLIKGRKTGSKTAAWRMKPRSFG